MPASVLADDPPLVSVASLKLAVNRLLTVAPLGPAVSSATDARVAVALKSVGASLTAVTSSVMVLAT